MNLRRPQPGFMRRTRERGVILVVALIFLILLTLLAIGASSGSLLQQRMVSATRNAQLALMSGNTALRGAEWQLWSSASVVGNAFPCDAGDINGTTGCVKYDPQSSSLYGPTGTVTLFRTGNNAWLGTGREYTRPGSLSYVSGNDTGNIAKNPRYIIEDMGRVLPPGAGPQCESGVTGCNSRANGSGQIELHIYRITARATGGNDSTVRVVESTFDAQTNSN